MTKGNGKKLAIAGTVIAAGCFAAEYCGNKKLKKRKEQLRKDFGKQDFTDSHAYFVGGGLASMAGAAYLIRDCRFMGSHIHIYEGADAPGESQAFVCPGLSLIQESVSENFWDLLSGIPSLHRPEHSVKDEMLAYDRRHAIYTGARLIDRNGGVTSADRPGFDKKDRELLVKLMVIPEEKLDDLTIQDWFAHDPHFFETDFWYVWRTTFAFQPWSSLFELRRCLGRMILDFAGGNRKKTVSMTPMNPYDSFLHPLQVYLKEMGVQFVMGAVVQDIDFDEEDEFRATALHIQETNRENTIVLGKQDLCFMTVGAMLDQASFGSLDQAADFAPQRPVSAELWQKVTAKKDGLGNPEPFFANIEQSMMESITITSRGTALARLIQACADNHTEQATWVTLHDSPWLISCVVPGQPCFAQQSRQEQVVWAYGLCADRPGDHVKKTMRECSGREILEEILYQMRALDRKEEILREVRWAVPCIMPYAAALHQPRKKQDRPHMVPEGSRNFAMIGQFVEVPGDVVFTEEYSVRTARTAVYKLTGNPETVCPVTPYKTRPLVCLRALRRLWT
ncbi:MAG: oleate hydratase [Lachnospiraceae bacterium]|nr:oleate hydratase [Lachnospiraceae bacterium]